MEDRKIFVDDDSVDHEKLSTLLENDISYQKNNFIKNIEIYGNDLIQEKKINEIKREKKRNEYIDYINKNNKHIDLSNIMIDMLEDKELKLLFDEVKTENKSFLKKLFEFIFLNK